MFAEVKCAKYDLGEVVGSFLIYFAEVCKIPTYYFSETDPLSTVVRPLVAALSRLPVDMRSTLTPDDFKAMVEAGERIEVSGLVEANDEDELKELLSEANGKTATIVVNHTLGGSVAAIAAARIVSIGTK